MQRVYVVDDDQLVRNSLCAIVENEGHQADQYASGVEFLADLPDLAPGCVTLDVKMPIMDGLQVLDKVQRRRPEMPVIMITGAADVAMAVRAMRSGARDFIEKPFDLADVAGALTRVLAAAGRVRPHGSLPRSDPSPLQGLTKRETEVLSLLMQGDQNKVVGQKLGISPRTVEVHRARIMQRLNVTNFAALVRYVVQSGMNIE